MGLEAEAGKVSGVKPQESVGRITNGDSANVRVSPGNRLSQGEVRTIRPGWRAIGKVSDRIKERQQVTARIVDELQNNNKRSVIIERLTETPENSPQIHEVSQAEYSVANSSQVGWLATRPASPCFIVTLHDRIVKKGSLSHLDVTTDSGATLDEMADAVFDTGSAHETNGPRWKATIRGGDGSSIEDFMKAYDRMQEWKKKYGDSLEIEVGETLQGTIESLALNLDTGELQRFSPLTNSTVDEMNKNIEDVIARASRSLTEGKKPAQFSEPGNK